MANIETLEDLEQSLSDCIIGSRMGVMRHIESGDKLKAANCTGEMVAYVGIRSLVLDMIEREAGGGEAETAD